MEFPYITAALGAFLIILQQTLMMSVGFHRTKTLIGVGVGEDQHLERKMRRHGNLVENAAIFLAVLALTELSGAPKNAVVIFASVFAFARVSHALGFMHLDGSHNPKGSKLYLGMRAIGAFGSALGGIALGVYLAYRLFA